MPKVLISDKLSLQAVEVFKKLGVDVDVKTGLTPVELKEIIGEYDGLAIRSATKVTADIISSAKNLKVIGRAGIGVDNVDIPAASANGIIVMNTPFGNSITTAEHAISMMMALARHIPQASASTQAGKWEKSRFMGVEVTGKTLGLIGCGNIGSIVANRAQGLKMKVIGFDPYLSNERATELNIEKVEFEELLKIADFISLHTPLTDGTRGIINADAISKIKNTAFIINCARGGLIDEYALKIALENNNIAGAALDVYEVEPAKENPLFGLDNLICTPHLGASTSEAQENVAVQVAEQIADYLVNGTVANALNMPSISSEEAVKLKPYMNLAEILGSLAGQLTGSAIKEVVISYEGKAAHLNIKPLTAILLKALLAPLTEGVNMVNAPIVANERGISVSAITKENSSEYQELITISVTTDNRTKSISGTIFGGEPRIVSLHNVKLEAAVGSYMLYVNNEDKAGLIGNLGQILGDAKINIANFHLGRSNDASDAIALLAIDEKISSDILSRVSKLPSVKQVEFLTF